MPLLPVLRQFGDRFAVALLAGIAFLLPNDLAGRIGELLVGLASGYLLIRGGSFGKCVLLRVLYSTLVYARLILIYSNHSLSLMQYVLILLNAGAACVLFYAFVRRRKLRLSNRATALPAGRKLLAFIQTVTTLPWIAAAALVTLLQLFY